MESLTVILDDYILQTIVFYNNLYQAYACGLFQ